MLFLCLPYPRVLGEEILKLTTGVKHLTLILLFRGSLTCVSNP